METRFEWDENKNQANLRKHGIGFDEAARVFDDPLALLRFDRIQDGEQRWQTIGSVQGLTLILVVHTVWEETLAAVEVIRIISARPGEPKERKAYEAQHG